MDSFLFFVVHEGRGKLEYVGDDYDLKAGDCAFVDCHMPYRHMTDPEDLWTLQWCHFNGAGLEEIYRKYKERGGTSFFHPRDISRYSTLLDEIYSLAAGTDYIRDMRINEKLWTLLTYLMEESWNPEEARRQERCELKLLPVREYLENHATEHISLDELAEMFYINKYHLARSFKEQFGNSTNEPGF